eukprot:26502-Eustigmatos_ZCMA.PRE.1
MSRCAKRFAVSSMSVRPWGVVCRPGTMFCRNWRSASDMAPGMPAPPDGLRSSRAISPDRACAASRLPTLSLTLKPSDRAAFATSRPAPVNLPVSTSASRSPSRL